MPFRPLSDDALFDLDDDQLVAYVVRARAESHGSWQTGVQLLVYRHERRVRRKVSLKVPAHLVEEITDRALVEAIGSTFSKSSPGQFFSWLDTIVARVIADDYRSPAGKMRRQERAMPEGDEAGEEMRLDPIAARDAFGRALAKLDNEMHRDVVRLYFIEDRKAKEIAELLETTENNVHQIAKRFREILRGLLDEEDWA